MSRADRLRAELRSAGLDAAVLVQPTNVAYVSGFAANPFERLIALVVPRDGPVRLACPALEAEAAREAVAADVVLDVWEDADGPANAVAAALGGAGSSIGIEKRSLTVANAELVAEAAGNVTLRGCDDVLERMRIVKDEAEIDALRRAAAIVDAVVVELQELASPGATEAELAAECAHRLRAAGGGPLPFDPLVLTGARSALPHGHPGDTAVREGDLLILDIGAAADGYFADITRTIVVAAEPSPRQQEIFDVVHAAQRAGVEAATAGAAASEVDVAARSIIAAAGYGPQFVHRTGHGLGLDVHEPPYLTATNEQPLAAGMVVTVEPGIYVEGFGGVRIEDDVVVREDGPEILTRAPIAAAAGRLRA